MNILYVTTISDTIGFLTPHIEMLIKKGNKVDVAFRMQKNLKEELETIGCGVHEISFNRNPLSLENIKAYKAIKKLILDKNYNIVHTHTPVASVIVRLACMNIDSVKVMYTAHGFHFYEGAPKINWLTYYPIEKFLSKHTDQLITINYEDYKIANNNFNAKNLSYVPGVGLDLKHNTKNKNNGESVREELGISKNDFVLLSVGELNNNKNHQTIIKALSKLQIDNAHYIICGEGQKEEDLNTMVKDLNLVGKVHLLGFRKDVFDFYEISDVYILPSFREGLSRSLMEAMAAELAIVCSDIRGNRDLIEDGVGGYLVKPDDTEGFVYAIEKLHAEPELKSKFEKYNYNKIDKYEMKVVLESLEKVYNKVII